MEKEALILKSELTGWRHLELEATGGGMPLVAHTDQHVLIA